MIPSGLVRSRITFWPGYHPFVISRNGVPGGPPEGQKRALGGSTKNRLHRLKVRPGPLKPGRYARSECLAG